MLLANHAMPDREQKDDHTPIKFFPIPLPADAPAAGRVMLMIEYLVDPVHAVVFRSLMLDQVRRSRLRHGALSWELLHDINTPTRYVEVIIDASWTEHLRRFERFTVADGALLEQKLAFHTGKRPPHVSRCLMESTVKSS
jgi:quinol monooxygenase YgiN